MLDENSDTWVLNQLSPELLLREATAERREETWPEFMDRMMGLIHQQNFGREDVERAFHSVPFSPAMIKALEYCTSNKHEIVVISGANDVFIDIILHRYQVKHHISRVHTHRGRWNTNGRLRVYPYHHIGRLCPEEDTLCAAEEEKPVVHGCDFCPVDLCKGAILRPYLSQKKYSKVFYIGDSTNDFCPSLHLSKMDHVLARRNFKLHKLLSQQDTTKEEKKEKEEVEEEGNIPISRRRLQAKLHLWDSADDVLAIFQQEMGHPPH
ncbi:putative phosphatase phospho1, variant 2 [Balamuthia mandrillaris]